MKGLVFLLIGFIGGAALALFFAPESGDVLRAQLGNDAATERQKLNDEVHRSLANLQTRVDTVHADLSSYIQSAQGQDSSDDADPAVAVVAVED